MTFLPWLRVDEPEKFGLCTLVPKNVGLSELKGHDRAYADATCAAYIELHTDADGKHAGTRRLMRSAQTVYAVGSVSRSIGPNRTVAQRRISAAIAARGNSSPANHTVRASRSK